MSVLINFKICDNSKDCNGIKLCPSGALFWNEKKRFLCINNSKCVSCGRCEESCQVGAIRVAKDDEEYNKIKNEIARDSRKISDLFIDRYGAESIQPEFLSRIDKFEIQILQSTKPAIVEMFNDDSIHCLLFSIPIKKLFKNMNIMYRKLRVDESFVEKYKIKQLPSLVFFNNGKVFGKIDGYFDAGEEEKLKENIDKIMTKIKQ